MLWLAKAIVCVGVAGNPMPQCVAFKGNVPLETKAECEARNAELVSGLRERLAVRGLFLLSAKTECTKLVKGTRI